MPERHVRASKRVKSPGVAAEKLVAMADNPTDQLRSELAEIRRHIEACRRDLGIGGAAQRPARRRSGLLRALRTPRRHAPLA